MSTILKKYQKYGKQFYEMTGGVTGYMIPSVENGRLVERTLLKTSNPGRLHRPFAWVCFDLKSGNLLYYKHCMYEDFVNTQEHPAGAEINGGFISPRTAKEQAEHEKELWESYEKIRGFVLKDDISEEQKELVRKYKKQWELTVMTDLLPYYQALSPEFFEWLNKIN